MFCTRALTNPAMVWSRPDESTALPRARPPAARMIMVHGKLLKSSLVRIPVPKNNTIGIKAMTPMSPKTDSSDLEAHQRPIVMRVTTITKICVAVVRSLMDRIGAIEVPWDGLNVTSNRSQMRRMDTTPTGMTMKNHCGHVGAGVMMPMATTFCGEAIGESMPPMLDARAMPMITAFDMFESGGRVRSIGCLG